MKIPAIPFMTRVKNYALENNLRFFTWKEQRVAMQMYVNAIFINQ